MATLRAVRLAEVRGSVFGSRHHRQPASKDKDSPHGGWAGTPRGLGFSLTTYRKVNNLDLRKRSTDRGRCSHNTLPVQVLPVGGGKKIAHCPGCGRSGLACESSAEALTALRSPQGHALLGPPVAARGRVMGGKR